MRYRVLIFVFMCLAQTGFGQFKDRIVGKEWILYTPKIDTMTFMDFEVYNGEKIDINTMIWKFLPNGKLAYDYKSNSDVDACLGVDFLDIDLDNSYWKWDPNRLILILQIKGGYASIDDFIFKSEYSIHFNFNNQTLDGFSLLRTKNLSYKILNPEYAKP
ncbi:MAG: hypothetical protein ACRCVT_10320 [Leadbetterella sp.]